jgi:hypothetical protein
MSINLFLIIFNLSLLAVFTSLLLLKRLRNLIYFALISLLVVFDFAALSYSQIYLLHKADEDAYVAKLKQVDGDIEQRMGFYKSLSEIQLQLTLAAIAEAKNDTEQSVQQKINWRDQIIVRMQQVGFSDQQIKQVREDINASVHRYLMETLSNVTLEHIGHRNFSEFVRRKPRDEWTDASFVAELDVYLKQNNLSEEVLSFQLKRLRVFDESGVLIEK